MMTSHRPRHIAVAKAWMRLNLGGNADIVAERAGSPKRPKDLVERKSAGRSIRDELWRSEYTEEMYFFQRHALRQMVLVSECIRTRNRRASSEADGRRSGSSAQREIVQCSRKARGSKEVPCIGA